MHQVHAIFYLQIDPCTYSVTITVQYMYSTVLCNVGLKAKPQNGAKNKLNRK